MNTTDKGLPELPREAAGYGRGCNIEIAEGSALYTADQMRAMYEKGKQDAISAASGKAVAWINPQVLNSIARYKFLERVNHRVRLRSLPHPGENSIPLYLHPATVTDEDVERAADAIKAIRNDAIVSDTASVAFAEAALSSFANKENRND